MTASPFCETGFGTGNEEIQLKPHLDKTRVFLAPSAKIWSLFFLKVAPTTACISALHMGKRLKAKSQRTSWVFFFPGTFRRSSHGTMVPGFSIEHWDDDVEPQLQFTGAAEVGL